MRELTSWNFYEIALLGLMVYREARGEPRDAQICVAHTVMNRVANASWWGSDIVSVVTKKWQYSSMTDPNDKQLTTWPKTDDNVFEQCLGIARMVVEGTCTSPLKGIDSYYDDSLQGDLRPKWAKEHPECFVGKAGRLSFYNLDQDYEL